MATRSFHRPVTALASVSIAALLLAGCASGSAEGAGGSTGDGEPQLSGEIIWADFGGPTNEARQEIYFAPFTEDTGVDVVSVVINDAMQDAMLEGSPGDYDAMHTGLDLVYAYQENLIEIPEENQDQALPEDIRSHAFGTFFVGHAQAYLTDTFPDGGPETWADFWDVEKFPGKRAWPGTPGSYDSSCEIALLADGVDPDELYPLDFDRCAAKLDELRDDMVFYMSYPEIQQLLVSGSAAVAMGPSGQFAALRRAGEDVTISWDQAIVAPNVIVIPGEAPNPDNILALTSVFHDPELQAQFAERTNYGPGNPDAYEFIPEDVQDNLVNAPSHTTVVNHDSKWRGENRAEYLEFYTTWLSS
ncbi:extracellular solute-binding protein [Microbacterium trichothecenolyticum]|uniref:extracellular solute-binding protein n=1 Tax=Microbacterium trichothecenolyticum TaxID=69370 RepID=UPI0035BE8BD2